MFKKLTISLDASITSFESPAISFSEPDLSIHRLLIDETATTSLLAFSQDYLAGFDIFSGCTLIVDHKRHLAAGCFVVARVGDEDIVAKYLVLDGLPILCTSPSEGNYINKPITEECGFVLIGIVTAVIVHVLEQVPAITVRAGEQFNLDEMLVSSPNSSFVARVSGNSLSGINILDHDIVVVCRKRPLKDGSVIAANYNMALVVKKIDIQARELISIYRNKLEHRTKIKAEDIFTHEGTIVASLRCLLPESQF